MRFVFRVLYDAFLRFSQDDGWAIASHVALSILTSLFPFLILVTALAGFLGSKNLGDEGVQILFQTWPQQAAAPIANELHNVLTQTRSGVLTIGVILSVYFSSSGVEAVRIGLNRAYDVRDSRPWWLLRLESIAYVFVGAFSLLTLAFLVVLAPLIWAAVVYFAPVLRDNALRRGSIRIVSGCQSTHRRLASAHLGDEQYQSIKGPA
jgi:membrane protein